MKNIIHITSVLSLLFISSISQAETMEVIDIVKKAIHAAYYQGGDARANVDMRIIDKQGRCEPEA